MTRALSEEDLQRFDRSVEALIRTDQPRELDDLLRSLVVSRMTHEQRIKHWRPRAAGLVMGILRSREEQYLREACWDILGLALKLSDRLQEDPSQEEIDTMDFGVSLGMIPALVAELSFRPVRPTEVIIACLITCTNICLSDRYVAQVAKAGLVEALVALIQSPLGFTKEVRLLALISLTNLALHFESHDKLLQCNVIEMCTGLLTLLSSTDHRELDFGLSAAFLICRLAGSDEMGPGMESIQSNDALLTKLHWILTQVLNAGPEGIVLGSHWNPANIVYDVSILAKSDRNKPLLARFVPVLLDALQKCVKHNKRLVKYTVATLVELHAHEESRREIEGYKNRFLAELRRVKMFEIEAETFQGVRFLQITLEASSSSIQDVLLSSYTRFLSRLTRGEDPD